MKILTNTLIGPALNWAVAKLEGCEWLYEDLKCEAPPGAAYSTDWAQGGPIIEREKIDIENTHWVPKVFYAKLLGDEPYGSSRTEGATLLTAAMRCYVASKLGDEVDVPEELL